MNARDIRSLPWGTYSHAYGSAADVPGQLLDLSSNDSELRGCAREELFGNIWHQGTVYEASRYAVPFLIQIAADPAAKEREVVLLLISCLARGSSYLQVHYDMVPRVDLNEPEIREQLETELKDVRLCREAVVERLPIIAGLFADPDASVRAAAAFVIGCVERDGAEFSDTLAQRIASESHPEAAASMILAYEAVGGDLGELAVAGERLVDTAKAVATIARDPVNAPEVALDTAVSAIVDPPELTLDVSANMWFEPTVADAVVGYLRGVPTAKLHRHVGELVESLAETPDMDRMSLLALIAPLVFAKPFEAKAMDPLQKRLIATVASGRDFHFTRQKKLVLQPEVEETLRRCGVPVDVEELRKLGRR